MTAVLSVDSVVKSYGKVPVLKGISLAVEHGEIFGLVGLNGAGKTTLIKIILDLLRPDQGHVHLNGRVHTDYRARQELCYLPEKFQPSHLLTGQEFLKFTLAYYRVPYNAKQAEEGATQLALKPEVLRRRVGSYSKGMMQKLGLLSGMLAKRPLLLLDEPMSGLDPEARICLKALLKQYKAEGRSIFFSSHILSDIEEICDRIAVLHDGRLHYTGTPSDFVAAYEGKLSLEQAFLHSIREGRQQNVA